MEKITFKSRANRLLNIAPTRIVVLSFAILILTGSLLLNLPIASNNGRSIGYIDALFTATSASCVTGLVVADTLTQWSLFGQIVIMLLIQTGGLGIVTLATFFSVLLGRKVRLKGMLLAQESINHFSFEGVLKLIRNVVIVTFSIEFIGAILLSISFVPKFGLRGIYLGIFHSVSAFCNAGFDLMGGYKSFTEYNNDPLVIYTISFLIITGGLGFMVWKDLFQYRKTKSLLLHTKVVLSVTACLLFFGTLFFYVSEYFNPATMQDFTFFQRINASFFQSSVSRTAGFNSIDLGGMKEITKVATCFLMFIGGAPGSTAGGIKVTTFGVLLVAIISQVIGSGDTIMFKRRVAHQVTNKSLAITGLAGMVVLFVTTFVLAIQDTIPFIDVLFEAVSAFGTVGMSTGTTRSLYGVSKIAIILTMFLGRVGPLSFAIAFTLRSNKKTASDTVYPEGKIVVG